MERFISVRPRLVSVRPLYFLMRRHHAKCIQKYQGFAHSEEQASTLDNVKNAITNNPNIQVKIIEGKDAICEKCPSNGGKALKCDEVCMTKRDEKAGDILGLEVGKFYSWKEEITEKLKALTQKQHEEICEDCFFWKWKICKDTFQKSETK